MALYSSCGITWKVATDSTLAQILSSRSSTITEEADHDESATHHLELADGATDQAVALGGLATVQGLLIISDRLISVKINAGSVGVPIGHTAAEGGVLALPATEITSLSLTNASGEVANVYLSMVGI